MVWADMPKSGRGKVGFELLRSVPAKTLLLFSWLFTLPCKYRSKSRDGGGSRDGAVGSLVRVLGFVQHE